MHIGFDIGGTKTEVVVLNATGETLFTKRIPTVREYQAYLDNVIGLVTEAEAAVGATCTIGIGLPGVPDPDTGLIKNSNCVFLNDTDLQGDIERRLGRKIAMANDANCFALSEAVDGSAAGKNIVFGVILGTGCGGGLVVNGEMIVGLNANAGEWGHNPLPHYNSAVDGEPTHCFCGGSTGNANCQETYISGTGFARQYNVSLHADEPNAETVRSETIFQRLSENEPRAVKIYTLFIDQLARSLAVVINMLDPDAIVLGGGLSNVDRIYTDVLPQISKYTVTTKIKVNLYKAKFGDSSGIRGAAWLGRNLK